VNQSSSTRGFPPGVTTSGGWYYTIKTPTRFELPSCHRSFIGSFAQQRSIDREYQNTSNPRTGFILAQLISLVVIEAHRDAR
jgi:hypothetical protein